MIYVVAGAGLVVAAYLVWRFRFRLEIVAGFVVAAGAFLVFALSRTFRPLPPPPLPVQPRDDEPERIKAVVDELRERLDEFEEAKEIEDPADADQWLADRINRRGHAHPLGLVGLALILIAVGLLGLFTGCAKTPPQVFTRPIPEYPAPELVEAPEYTNPCPAAAPLTPGKAPPYVEGGLASCRAQIVPPATMWDLLQQEEAVGYFEDLLDECLGARERDRLTCQDSYDVVWTDNRGLRHEIRVQRAITIVVALLSAAAGYALGRLP